MLPLKSGIACSLVFLIGHAPCASAQRILEWPLRTTAGPEAVARGVEATFWNPAAIRAGTARGEAIVADQRTPPSIGLAGFAAAASWRLDARTVIAAGYQHVSIDDIGETSTSPLADAGQPTFAVSEDQFAMGASHALGAALAAGASVRYDRSNETGINQSSTSLGAGFLFSPAAPMRPVLGVTVLTRTGSVRYAGGVEVSGPNVKDGFDVRLGYGVRGGENSVSVEHRIGITGLWRQVIAVSGGVATTDAGGGRSWEPVLGASLRVSRYELGFLRETLASQFGAAYSFRFRFGLK